MTEWLKVHAWKACVLLQVPRVRISLSPPSLFPSCSGKMSYRVLALKYRPQTFDEVVGQPHVTTTLKNAILSGRVPHAMLLTGPRGTGKTTIARILAKAMNCETGPTPVPCNICQACTAITAGSAVDVFEIDGASNNSVDQVRELRENVAYMPSSSKFKIYIIDEVHMLSMAAFNALLKTLEEPPDHVLFIFATTEVHKIPVTILSRCQRHDLGRITLSQISAHLMALAANEGFTISQQSCDLIAGEADGSMRDSLSLLDRILGSQTQAAEQTAGPREIDDAKISSTLGIIDKSLVFDLADAIIQSRGADIIDLVDRIHTLGLDLKRFYASLIRHFRNLAVVKVSGNDKNTCDISAHDRQRMAVLTAGLSQSFLNQMLNTLLVDESLVKLSSHTRTAVEMVLLKLVQIRPGIEIDTMIKRLDDLARRFDSPDFKAPAQHDGPAQPRHEQPETRHPEQAAQPQQQRPPQTPQERPAQHRCEPSDPPRHKQPARHPNEQQDPQPPSQQSMPTAMERRQVPVNRQTPEPAPQPQTAPPLENPANRWNPFLNALADSLPFASAILSKGRLQKISNTDIVVELNGTAYDRSRLESKRTEIESACSDFFEKPLHLTLTGDCAPKEYGSDEKSPARLRQEILNHPLVADAIKRFNATVVDVKLNPRSNP